jgi:UDP-2,4-diacetamido-2,4,6-trideoxy-beta-L-altropyranose hydrolase
MRVSIRVDSSTRMGLGHAYRCLAIAEAFRAISVDVEVLTWSMYGSMTSSIFSDFNVRTLGEDLFEYEKHLTSPECLWNDDVQALDAQRTIQHLKYEDTLLVDSYGVGEIWEKQLQQKKVKLFRVLDSDGTRSFQTKQIKPYLWPLGHISDSISENDLSQISGNTCIPIARIPEAIQQISNKRPLHRSSSSPSRILLQFGSTILASELDRLTRSVFRVVKNRSIRIEVVGAEPLNGSPKNINTDATNTLTYVPPLTRDLNLQRAMKSDLVIGAAGVSAMERLLLGIPQLVIPIATNQLSNARSLHSWGIRGSESILSEIDDSELDRTIRGAIEDYESVVRSANRGTVLIDRFGADRIAHFVIDGIQPQLTFRDAAPADAATFFLWANSTSVRSSAGRAEEISPEEHLAWYAKALESKDTQISVLCLNGIPVGQCRLEKDPQKLDFKVDYSVDAGYRGRGLGKKLIHGSLTRHKHNPGLARYWAEVRVDNAASQKVLGALQFTLTETKDQMLRFERIENQN